MSAPAPYVTVADDGRLRWLTLTNRGRANAIPATGWGELQDAIEQFQADDSVRVLVLTGADDDFCAGADLSTGGGLDETKDPAANLDLMQVGSNVALALHRVTKPTVAAVDGLAVGAGMNLALGCDVVVATTRARFAEVFVRRGLTMDIGGTWLLPRLVGLARARDIALTGRMVEADEASRIGLVAHVTEPDELTAAATDVATRLASAAPLAVRSLKAALDRSSELSFEQALAFENQLQAVLLASEDAVEGIRSFVERRPPEFRGR